MNSLQACHGTEPISATPTSAVPGLLDNFSTPPGAVNTPASALYLHQQPAVDSGLNSYGALPTHVSPADLILNASSDSSSAAGASSPYTADSSISLSPVCSVAPSVGPTHPVESISTSARKSTARRGRPKSSASLSIQSSATLSPSPGKVRAGVPRNKQILYEPYEVPDGPLDCFVCPYCESGRPFATARRRRKQDIERHLKTHYSEASRSGGEEPQAVCDRVVPIESFPVSELPGKWWECGGLKVVGGCAKVFGREDSLLRHLKVGCRGPCR